MISVLIFPPLLQSGVAEVGNVSDRISSLSFSIDTSVGYDSLSLSFSSDLAEISDWMSYGIGRHVVVYNEAQQIVWEGFVNSISAPVGGVGISIGPLMSVSNKVAVAYSTKRYNTNPPIGGEPAETAFASDTYSQSLYGVLEEKVSGGEGDSTQMEQLRDVYLAERAYPETSTDLSLFSGSEPSISLECLGYAHFLDRAYYTQKTTTSTTDIPSKISSVLAAETNYFSSATFVYDTNATGVEEFEDGERTSLTVIKEAVSLGDSSNNRYIFGVFANRLTRYSQAPTATEYFYNEVSNSPPSITAKSGETIMPWDVLPGKWLFLSGIGASYALNQASRLDPRNMFIERVEYTAPMGLNLTGGKVSKFSQKLARLGLGIY